MSRAIRISALATLLAAVPVVGQAPGRLTFIGGLAWEQGGPGPSLTSSMAAAGLGDSHYEGGRSLAEYPRYYDGGLNLAVFVGGRYRFDGGPLSVELLISNGSRGHAEGYDALGPTRLLVRWSSFLATSTLGVEVGPIRLAAGPTLNVVFWDAERNWLPLEADMTLVPGVTAGASVGFEAKDVWVSVVAGARSFSSADLEPFLSMPLEARYNTYYLGMTLLPGG